jgi:hypothetical protein
VMAVDVTMQPAFSAGKPKMLFEGPYVPDSPITTCYDVSADGQRFLMLKPVEQAQTAPQIVVVQNWFEELKQKVPPGKKINSAHPPRASVLRLPRFVRLWNM